MFLIRKWDKYEGIILSNWIGGALGFISKTFVNQTFQKKKSSTSQILMKGKLWNLLHCKGRENIFPGEST